MHLIHVLLLFIYSKELGILVSGMSTLWEDTDGCTEEYRCDLDI